MSRPVEALPCGSVSKIKTPFPAAAKAVPRLMAVVVLPTPPFWLAIANTRMSHSFAAGEQQKWTPVLCPRARHQELGASASGGLRHTNDAAARIAEALQHVCLVRPTI